MYNWQASIWAISAVTAWLRYPQSRLQKEGALQPELPPAVPRKPTVGSKPWNQNAYGFF